jgi:hypothetical protein
MSIVIFWDVTPCLLLGGYRRFGGTYRPDDGDFQGLYFNHEKGDYILLESQ